MGLVRIAMPPAPLPSKVFAEGAAGGQVEQGVTVGGNIDLIIAQAAAQKEFRCLFGLAATLAGGYGMGYVALPTSTGKAERIRNSTAVIAKFVDSVG
jgi:hypothetical protein